MPGEFRYGGAHVLGKQRFGVVLHNRREGAVVIEKHHRRFSRQALPDLVLPIPGGRQVDERLERQAFARREAQLAQVMHHDIRPSRRQLVAVVAAGNPDHQAERALGPGFDACDRILDNRGAAGRSTQASCCLQQHRRVGLAGKIQLRRVAAVDPGIEQVEHAGVAQHRLGVATGGEHRGLDPGPTRGFDEFERARIGVDLVFCEPCVEVAVLAIAESADRFTVGVVVLVAVRQVDAARIEEASDAVHAGLAIHVLAVVAAGVERTKFLTVALGPRLEEFVEQSLPGGRVRLRRIGDHAVHVEQHGIQLRNQRGRKTITRAPAHFVSRPLSVSLLARFFSLSAAAPSTSLKPSSACCLVSASVIDGPSRWRVDAVRKLKAVGR
ncbi:MAG: hypothetical protein WA108_15010 [Thiobacillus sp.]